jgi:hypothetical protein
VTYNWAEGAHGVYLQRNGRYDDGPGGDNWAYIDQRILCIINYCPEGGGEPTEDPVIVAGPFPTLKAAKAAFLVIYGGSDGS